MEVVDNGFGLTLVLGEPVCSGDTLSNWASLAGPATAILEISGNFPRPIAACLRAKVGGSRFHKSRMGRDRRPRVLRSLPYGVCRSPRGVGLAPSTSAGPVPTAALHRPGCRAQARHKLALHASTARRGDGVPHTRLCVEGSSFCLYVVKDVRRTLYSSRPGHLAGVIKVLSIPESLPSCCWFVAQPD